MSEHIFTNDEKDTIRQLFDDGKTDVEIANKLGRGLFGVQLQRRDMRLMRNARDPFKVDSAAEDKISLYRHIDLIKLYWSSEGYDVKVWFDKLRYKTETMYYLIHSDLVNGLPKDWKRKNAKT